MENHKVAQIFEQIADILELQGVNRFRYLAYRRAAQIVDNLPTDVRTIYDDDPAKFQEIKGIGKDLSAKIVEILETGKCAMHEELLAGFNEGLLELLTIRGLGPKKVKKFHEELGIEDIHQLKEAAQQGKLAELDGMGEKSQTEILRSIEIHEQHRERVLLHTATYIAESLVEFMKECPEVDQVQYAGSCRRGKETIGDIDILATGSDHSKIIEHFVNHRDVEDILAHGDTKASIFTSGGIQVDLRVVEAKSFGAALYYFTGSKEHNIHARKLAIAKGYKLNEYGVFKGEKQLAGATEADMFAVLGLPYIIPEMRQDNGEVEAGLAGKLITPIELSDIKGDLHMHTTASDGKDDLETMVKAAQAKGYAYIAITDHSPSTRVANGLSIDRLENHLKTLDEIDKKTKGMKILKGSEIDILEDGTLDYPDEILAQLDLVNISVHSKFNLSAKEQTARIIKAMSNPHVTILCHPTGKVEKRRESYSVDMVKIARAAKEYNVALEVNGSARLDLNSANIRLAKDEGAKFVINTDSHKDQHLDFMRFGVMMARRGWLEKSDVINTLDLDAFLGFFNKPTA
jgi:DNA polymerase (family 10)